MITLIPPKTTAIAGYVFYTIGAAVTVFAFAQAAVDMTENQYLRGTLYLIMLGTIGWQLIIAGRIMGFRKSGFHFDEAEKMLFLEGGPPEANIKLALDTISQVELHRRQEYWGEEVKILNSLEIRMRDRWNLAIAESQLYDSIESIAEETSHATHLPLIKNIQAEELAGRSEPSPIESGMKSMSLYEKPDASIISLEKKEDLLRFVLNVGLGGTFQKAMILFAASALMIGIVLSTVVTETFFVGLIFGTMLGGMGVALLGVLIIKSWMSEIIDISAGGITHSYRILSFSWGKRSLASPFRLRIRPNGIQGFRLEAVKDEHIIIMANGVTKSSKVKPANLFWLINSCTESFRADQDRSIS
jgi:hypothetical protein